MKLWQLCALLIATYGAHNNWIWVNVAFCILFVVLALAFVVLDR